MTARLAHVFAQNGHRGAPGGVGGAAGVRRQLVVATATRRAGIRAVARQYDCRNAGQLGFIRTGNSTGPAQFEAAESTNQRRESRNHQDTLYGVGRGYGQGINTFVMQEGAWQAATLTGGIERFSPDLIQDASEVYSRIHFRNVGHAGFSFGGYERYQKETLLAYLLENQDVLLDHISNCTYEMDIVRSFLEKHDPTFDP